MKVIVTVWPVVKPWADPSIWIAPSWVSVGSASRFAIQVCPSGTLDTCSEVVARLVYPFGIVTFALPILADPVLVIVRM